MTEVNSRQELRIVATGPPDLHRQRASVDFLAHGIPCIVLAADAGDHGRAPELHRPHHICGRSGFLRVVVLLGGAFE